MGKARKLKIDDLEIEQVMRFAIAGSWLRGDRAGSGVDLETDLRVVSEEPAEKIREWVLGAERACFTIQSLHPGIALRTSVTLNGAPLEVEAG